MKTFILKLTRKFHKMLVWVSILALLAFVLSALTHPIMVWTGPQSTQFMPPRILVSNSYVKRIPDILAKSGVEQSIVTKVVPTELGPMLQLTTEERSPRRYFSLESGEEVADYDREQAIWLARFYTSEKADIKNVTLITEFSHQYPWVNRLIPVYKVDFANDENLSAYVYTETNVLAGLNNDHKRSMQTIFQAFHTFSWLDDYPIIRIGLMSVLLASLMAVLLSGFCMLLFIKRKQFKSAAQSYHRKIAWVILIPFFGFLFSAFYHLYQSEFTESVNGMRLGKAINLQQLPKHDAEIFKVLEGKALNSFSLVKYEDTYYYRASMASDHHGGLHKPHAHHGKSSDDNVVRNKRFDGVSKESSAMFIPLSGQSEHVTDKEVATSLALTYMNLSEKSLVDVQKVSRFGQGYDFRNKRLPVWKIALDTGEADHLYIDPVTGMLVDRSVRSVRLESLSFSVLHKWNFLLAFVSREQRDLALVTLLMTLTLLGVFGVSYRFKQK